MRALVLTAVLYTAVFAQPKPAVTPADYAKWEGLGASELSPDGKWLAYQVRRTSGKHELRLSPAGAKPLVAAFGENPAFSADSAWLAYSIGVSEEEQEKLTREKKPLRRKLGLVRLATGEASVVENISACAFSKEGAYLAMHQYAPERKPEAGGKLRDAPEPAGATLLVRNLASGGDTSFGSVSRYGWCDRGSVLAMTISAEAQTGNGVQIFDAASGQVRVLDSGPSVFAGLAWRKDALDLAVLRSKSNDQYESDTFLLLAWKNLAEKFVYDPTADRRFPPGKRTVKFRAPAWSEDGNVVFVGLGEWEKKPPKPGQAAKKEQDEPANVEVWHSRDFQVISEQKLRAERDRQRNTLAAWRLAPASLTPLSHDGREEVTPVKGGDGAVAFAVSSTPYNDENRFGRRYADLYRVDLGTGERTRIRTRLEFYAQGASAYGRTLVFFDDDQYRAYDFVTGKETVLTAGLKTSFVDREYDHPVKQKPPFGIAGWTKGAKSVIVYDEFDLWELAPDGSQAVRLTNGASEQVAHRYLRLDPKEEFIDPAKPLYLSLKGKWNGKTGVGRAWLSKPGVAERLVWLDKSVSRVAKAKSAEVYVYAAEAFDDPPDYFLGGPDLKDARQVSELDAFQNQYAWGHAELIEYRNSGSHRLLGALYYPSNYERGRQYPMIVHIYEKQSPLLHRYYTPSERIPYNPAVWTAQGYFVLQPDILFRARDPGRSALDCVTAAVRKVLAAGAVDAKRVGLIGHSWGGYETTFLVTQTDLFAAGVAGGPLTNLVSSYGEVYWNSGAPETGHAETGQERMQVPLYEDPQAFIRNSSVFFADKMKAPLLLCVGDKDGASDWHQDLELYNVARRAGKQCVLLIYPGENHHLNVKANQVDYHRRILEWFAHYLKGAPAPTWITAGEPFLEREKELEQFKKSKPQPAAAESLK
jgi:dipeptidyl aminopeptidase/acylaminoacyl peptidase